MEEENLLQGTMNTVAIIDHEMYGSWVAAGFSEGQAMQLLMQHKEFTQASLYHDQHCQMEHNEESD